MNIKFLKTPFFIILIFSLQSCMTTPPENPDNICLIFEEKKSWYKAAMKSEKRWKIPPYVLMSFVYQESSFKADAKPERTKLLWVIPWKRKSTAVGYSQALNMTWEDYKDETGNSGASRKNFKDSADFIGWYVNQTYKRLKISKKNYFRQYLAYHEGWKNYKHYNKKSNVVGYAKQVSIQSIGRSIETMFGSRKVTTCYRVWGV